MDESNGAESFSTQVSDAVQFAVDLVEDLLAMILDAIRERPAVAVAIVAGVLGAMIGNSVGRRRQTPPAPVQAASGMGDLVAAIVAGLGSADLGRAAKDVGGSAKEAQKATRKVSGRLTSRLGAAGSAMDLVGIGVQLLENPLVRTYLRMLAAGQVRRMTRR